MIKEQIINTAFDLFSQYGIKSVSMDDVAKAAGISKRTLYESFEDKETLLIEGIDHNTESLGQYLTGLEKEPFNALEVILLFYEEMMKNPRWFNEKFYEDLKKYPKAQQKIEMNKARMGKRCMDLFTRGVKEGRVPKGDQLRDHGLTGERADEDVAAFQCLLQAFHHRGIQHDPPHIPERDQYREGKSDPRPIRSQTIL